MLFGPRYPIQEFWEVVKVFIISPDFHQKYFIGRSRFGEFPAQGMKNFIWEKPILGVFFFKESFSQLQAHTWDLACWLIKIILWLLLIDFKDFRRFKNVQFFYFHFFCRDGKFIVRMGDWDTSSPKAEPLPHMEFNVSRVIIHPKYNSSNLQNSIAILRLAQSVPLGRFPSVGTACLPRKCFLVFFFLAWNDCVTQRKLILIWQLITETPIRGIRCLVAGRVQQWFRKFLSIFFSQVGVETILNTDQTKPFKEKLIYPLLIQLLVKKLFKWQNSEEVSDSILDLCVLVNYKKN